MDSAVPAFYSYLDPIFSHTIPTKTSNNKYPIWYTNETKKLLRTKGKVRKLLLKKEDPNIAEELKSLRSSVKISIKKDCNAYLQNTENYLISEPKKFWSYFKTTKSMPNKIFHNNVCYDGDHDIANGFADYF